MAARVLVWSLSGEARKEWFRRGSKTEKKATDSTNLVKTVSMSPNTNCRESWEASSEMSTAGLEKPLAEVERSDRFRFAGVGEEGSGWR